MRLMTIVGPSDSGKTTLVEQLADRLAERGRVGTVKHLNCAPDLDTEGTDTARHRGAGASETHGIRDDGSWFATGADRDLETLLSEIAGRCDYLLVEGYSSLQVPTVALGGRDHAGRTLVAADDAEAIDVDEVLALVEALDPVTGITSTDEQGDETA